MKPVFSVIMPCYNSESYVKNAVDSVINQKYTNWELIAINDGSSDNTLAILDEYAKYDQRIKVYTKENGGYATAVNYGLERINGDYLLMMGSDDTLSEQLFFEIVDSIDNKFPDMIGFRTIRVVDGLNNGLDSYTRFDEYIYKENTSIREFEADYPNEAGIFAVRDTSKIYKKELLGDLRYFGKYGYDADGIFSMLFSHKSHSFCIVPIDGYYWTLRSDSVSAKTSLEIDLDRLNDWKLFYKSVFELEASELTKKEKQYIQYYYMIIYSVFRRISKRPIFNWNLIQNQRTVAKAIRKYNAKADFSNGANKQMYRLVRFPFLWYCYNYFNKIRSYYKKKSNI